MKKAADAKQPERAFPGRLTSDASRTASSSLLSELKKRLREWKDVTPGGWRTYVPGFSCYPQPFANGADILTLRMRSGTRQEGVVISLFDAVGRRFHEKEIGGFGPGESTVQLDLSGVAFAHLPAHTIVFIELRTKDQRLYTKTILVNNR